MYSLRACHASPRVPVIQSVGDTIEYRHLMGALARFWSIPTTLRPNLKINTCLFETTFQVTLTTTLGRRTGVLFIITLHNRCVTQAERQHRELDADYLLQLQNDIPYFELVSYSTITWITWVFDVVKSIQAKGADAVTVELDTSPYLKTLV